MRNTLRCPLMRARFHSLSFDYSPGVGRAKKIEENLRRLWMLCPRHQESMDDGGRHDVWRQFTAERHAGHRQYFTYQGDAEIRLASRHRFGHVRPGPKDEFRARSKIGAEAKAIRSPINVAPSWVPALGSDSATVLAMSIARL